MEIEKLREVFEKLDVHVEDLSDEQVVDIAQTIVGCTVQLGKLYHEFIMDTVKVLQEVGSKLAEVSRADT